MEEVKPSNPQPRRRTGKATQAGAYDDQAKQEALARTKRRKHDSGHKNWVYNVWTKPMPLLSELMSSHTSAPPLPDGQVLLEAGVLAYRRQKHGELQILLVSKKRSKKWGIPKEAYPVVPGCSKCSIVPCAGDLRRARGGTGWLGRDR
jgi:hypothetical protein